MKVLVKDRKAYRPTPLERVVCAMENVLEANKLLPRSRPPRNSIPVFKIMHCTVGATVSGNINNSHRYFISLHSLTKKCLEEAKKIIEESAHSWDEIYYKPVKSGRIEFYGICSGNIKNTRGLRSLNVNDVSFKTLNKLIKLVLSHRIRNYKGNRVVWCKSRLPEWVRTYGEED